MIFGTKNKKIYEHFSVTDESNTLVSGISPTAFTVDLFKPDGEEVGNQIDTDVVELSEGHYRAEFTPNETGTWYMTVYHGDYFPWGKSDDILVYASDFDTVTASVKQNRNYNVSVEDVIRENISSTASQTARSVSRGRTDYIVTQIKGDDTTTWSGSTTSGISYAWYRTVADTIPYKIGGPF